MYVAVCEYARSHTKAPKSYIFNRALVAGVLLSILSFNNVIPVYAANQTVEGKLTVTGASALNGNVTIGATTDDSSYSNLQLHGILQANNNYYSPALGAWASANPEVWHSSSIVITNTGIKQDVLPTNTNMHDIISYRGYDPNPNDRETNEIVNLRAWSQASGGTKASLQVYDTYGLGDHGLTSLSLGTNENGKQFASINFTPDADSNNNQIATTAFVKNEVRPDNGNYVMN